MKPAEEKNERHDISTGVLLGHTIFGLTRITLYLLLPALGATWVNKHFFVRSGVLMKLIVLFVAFVFSWAIVFVDYRLYMRRISLRKR